MTFDAFKNSEAYGDLLTVLHHTAAQTENTDAVAFVNDLANDLAAAMEGEAPDLETFQRAALSLLVFTASQTKTKVDDAVTGAVQTIYEALHNGDGGLLQNVADFIKERRAVKKAAKDDEAEK